MLYNLLLTSFGGPHQAKRQPQSGCLDWRPPLRCCEKSVVQRRDIRRINLFIRHLINARPVRLCWLLQICFVRHGGIIHSWTPSTEGSDPIGLVTLFQTFPLVPASKAVLEGVVLGPF